MASLCECRFLHRTLTIDDISNKPNCSNLKFKRAFQFLQLLLIQRVYGIDIITKSGIRKSSKSCRSEQEQQQELQNNYEVFLGGSCNPTTWRHDQAIPYFQSRSVSYYNPQVADWTPDLLEVEHRAKELAPLLFFVIDHDTRALASIVEVCYLAARGRNIIVVMNPMPDKNHTKFIQQKGTTDEKDNEGDYENVCEARRILRALLRSINIPVFDNVRIALECAAFLLETTKHSVRNNSTFNEENKADVDVPTPLPKSSLDFNGSRSAPVVVVRSLSNKTAYESTDEFYRQMNQSEISKSKLYQRRLSSTPASDRASCQLTSICTKTQLSSSTNESDDDGYCSFSSSNHTLSQSTSSLTSDLFESVNDQQHDENSPGFHHKSSNSMITSLVSNFYSYIPFVQSSNQLDSSVSQSLLVLFTLPFRFIKDALFPTTSPLPLNTRFFSSQESTFINLPSPTSSFAPPIYMFDIYIVSGEHDQYWVNIFAMPSLETLNLTFTKRQFYRDNDQIDALYDNHLRKQSRVLYYLINSSERLSHLATELAFVIGERKHNIIVYLKTAIDDDAENILSKCERRDIQRSRTYLEDLARKESITLCYSRAQSWQKVLEFFHLYD